jgi:uncharacterized membrane protein HdeD (DUF308 family)
MSNGPPWKTALIGAVAITAGFALLFVDWTLAQLAAFVAMLFVARGALHIVTTSFVGVEGALSALTGCGELAVGVATLAWPSPTLLALAVIVGVWVLAHGVVDATMVLATRGDRPRWLIRLLASVLEIALGVVLIARPGGTVRDSALALGLLALLEGVIEISLAAAHKLSDRRVHGPASVRPAVAAVS